MKSYGSVAQLGQDSNQKARRPSTARPKKAGDPGFKSQRTRQKQRKRFKKS